MPRHRNSQQELEPEVKTIFVVISGTDGESQNPVDITPGTRAINVLTQLNLEGYRLENPDGSVFGPTDDLYSALDKFQKVYALPDDVRAGDCYYHSDMPSDEMANVPIGRSSDSYAPSAMIDMATSLIDMTDALMDAAKTLLRAAVVMANVPDATSAVGKHNVKE